MASKNLSDDYLECLSAVQHSALPEAVTDQAKRCLLDYLGVTLAGATILKDKATALLNTFGGAGGRATVIGLGSRSGVDLAAFVNGHTSHVAELDDGSRYGAIHPGAPVLSALLPLAEVEGCNRESLLRGMIVGYEASIRLATAVQPTHYQRGFHPTATCGAIGAALGAGAMLNFTASQMKAALAAASISAGGSLKVLEDDSELKPFNAGHAAQNGLMAARAARAGFKAPGDCLGGPAGFLAMMAAEADQTCLTTTQTGCYSIESVYFKPYASCRHTHAPIEAALALKRRLGCEGRDVESVVIRTYEGVLGKHDHQRIQGVGSAKMSIPYSVAVALFRGCAGLSEFEPSIVTDGAILALTENVRVQGDPAITALVPRQRAAVVEVRLRDGRTSSERVDYPIGEPENPFSEESLAQKFTALATYGGKSTAQAGEIAQAVQSRSDTLDHLFALL